MGEHLRARLPHCVEVYIIEINLHDSDHASQLNCKNTAQSIRSQIDRETISPTCAT
jgi:hypothetical protein